MVDEDRLTWHPETEHLEYECAQQGDARLDTQLARELGAIARAGRWREHRVREVLVRFPSEEAAARNADALSYLGVGAVHPGGRLRSTLRFVPRTDFGLDEED